MRVALLTTEAVPFAKTGGLADVAGALPKALVDLGIHMDLIMPKYGTIDAEQHGLKKLRIPDLMVPVGSRYEKIGGLADVAGEVPAAIAAFASCSMVSHAWMTDWRSGSPQRPSSVSRWNCGPVQLLRTVSHP